MSDMELAEKWDDLISNYDWDILNQRPDWHMLRCEIDYRHLKEERMIELCRMGRPNSFGKNRSKKNEFNLPKVHMEKMSLNALDYPICPINMYFESDAYKTCNPDQCDFDIESRSCCEACKIRGVWPNRVIQGL
jgi:hypothetical protein